MRFVFLTGGCLGFVVVGGASALAGHDPDRALFDASVGCLVSALLFRWCWNVLIRAMRESLRLKHTPPVAGRGAASAATASAPLGAHPPPPPPQKT